jgi:SAM-dependent methyltransferase
LGAGTGQGYELLTKIDQRDLDISLNHRRVVPKDEIGCYLGLDLDEAMVQRGRELFADNPAVQFARADLREGLGPVKEEQASFDMYLSAYGALSHLDTADLQDLLVDICEHGHHGSLVVLDLLGRYSMEWPHYWSATNDVEKWRPYSMSYLHPDGERPGNIETFPIRFWAGDEVNGLIREVGRRSNVRLEVLRMLDRSIMVGRHVDTGEYNRRLKPMRRRVNRLHEDYIRTDLDTLLFDRTTLPVHPIAEVNTFFDKLIDSWNTLVDFCHQRLADSVTLTGLRDWPHYSAPLQFALMTIDRVISSTSSLWYGDPRANVIEPQLGYALRSLELGLQRGLGAGHGLLVVLKVHKEG